MKAELDRSGSKQQIYAPEEWKKTKVIAVFRRFVLRQSFNKIGESLGFQLLSDGIHLNERSGLMLQKLVSQFISANLKD